MAARPLPAGPVTSGLAPRASLAGLHLPPEERAGCSQSQLLKMEAGWDQVSYSFFFCAKPTGSDSVSSLKSHMCCLVERPVCEVWRWERTLWKAAGSSPSSAVTLLCDSGLVTDPL